MCEVKQTVSDVIGDSYKNWDSNQIVIIGCPTGSGKSYFIFETLLDYAKSNHKRILYLVNRKVLRAQLDEQYISGSNALDRFHKKYGDIYLDIRVYIQIYTYQYIESLLLKNIFPFNGNEFDYIVYDECHYFYSDSNFNSNTKVSYNYLRNIFIDKTHIFMSATIKNMRNFISNFTPDFNYAYNACFTYNLPKQEYCIPKNYDYLSVSYFNDISDLICLIGTKESDKQKWLIFTDSKDRGKDIIVKIKDDIQTIKDEDIVFIDTNYKKNEDSSETMDEIVKKNLMNKMIIISTPVMDNGISIKDIGLRNLVLLCDTEEEFIQMIGRKREDGEKVNLYLWKRDVLHFKRRFQYWDKINHFYEDNKNKFFWIEGIHKFFKDAVGKELESISHPNGNLSSPNGNESNVFNQLWFLFDKLIGSRQGSLKLIFDDYNLAKIMCFPFKGFICLNDFSIQRCKFLCSFYKDMAERMENDEDAFLNEQLSWLNVDKSCATDISGDVYPQKIKNLIERISLSIKSSLKDKEIVKLEREDFLSFYGTFRKCMKEVYEITEDGEELENALKYLRRNDRPIPCDLFNSFMKKFELPYQLETEPQSSSKVYCVSKTTSH